MSITLEEAVFKFRDSELNLPERWFSGKEWEDGTAAKTLRQDYRRAVLEKDPTLNIEEDGLQLEFF